MLAVRLFIYGFLFATFDICQTKQYSSSAHQTILNVIHIKLSECCVVTATLWSQSAGMRVK